MSRAFFLLLIIHLFSPACDTANGRSRTGDDRELVGRAVKVIDGDTFDLLVENSRTLRVRLYGIDCPERAQPFSKVATEHLGSLLSGKPVRVEVKDKDRYRRTIGVVFVDGKNINEEMLRQGMAWHFTQYDKNPAWKALQEQARSGRIGLWAEAHPVAPWDWKKDKRKKGKTRG